MVQLLVVLLFLIGCVSSERGSKDLVENVPGLIFKPNYKTYSGYLYANEDKTWKMHYLLTTSRSNNADPVVFWFNGGPGASSLLAANVVFMESPIGVGFSYDTENVTNVNANDTLTAEQNYNAIYDFFNDSHPEYKDRDFYLAGESYAGMYIPLLTEKIAGLVDKFSNKNFRGILIGNGEMYTTPLAKNTQHLWRYYHGMVGEDDWLILKKCCKDLGQDMDNCDYSNFYNNPSKKECEEALGPNDKQLDPFDVYKDCYTTDLSDFRSQLNLSEQERKDPARYFNYQSTDGMLGYPCYILNVIETYFNQVDIGDAFNIDKEFYDGGGVFHLFGSRNYRMQYNNMTEQFHNILNTLQNFKILIYNGDTDLEWNYLGAARFIKQIMDERQVKPNKRRAWYFRKSVAGYSQRYVDSNNSIIDVLTIKGAGHFAPRNRPGPALQMLTRFLAGAESYGDVEDDNPGVPKAQPYN